MRLRDVILTALLWAFYFYLIRWGIWVALGAVGLGDVLDQILPPLDVNGQQPRWTIVDTLSLYGSIAAFNAALMIAWSLYNRMRFRGRERRRFVPMVTPADLARLYAVPTQAVERWQGLRHLVIHHDADGNLVYVHQTEEGYFERNGERPADQIQRPKTIFPVVGEAAAERLAVVGTAPGQGEMTSPLFQVVPRSSSARLSVRRSSRARSAPRPRRRGR
ncbi:MAG TPA: poly-beta-1,6-N-acetyl-D-glucosamine biosynthesis protein PgaD [Alphaproteobacteria bacterium]|nr:poly-beta-1,6-N-acetyl-D-glucosamine biosynthesis protein PgaD [Alphaproteobacteria bacterium]